MVRPQPTINITTSTQYSWKEGFAVYLLRSEGSCVLWSAKTWWNGYWWSLPTTINKTEPSVEAKTTKMGEQNTQSNFAPWQCTDHVAKPVKTYLENIKWDVLPHASYSPDLTPSDYYLFRSMQRRLLEQHFNS